MYAELPEPAPELKAWEAAMRSRPGVAKYLEGAEPVLYEQVAAGQVHTRDLNGRCV